jgi:hypothetical protein
MKTPLLILLCFCSFIVHAQIKNIDIDADYDSITFQNFVKEIEKSHPVKFYFKESWIDSLIIKQTHRPTTLTTLLDDSFGGFNLDYLIDGSNIIITKKYKITTSLANNFFVAPGDTRRTIADTIDLKHAFVNQGTEKVVNSSNGIITIGDPAYRFTGKKGEISGIVRSEKDGEPITGVVV